MAKSNKQPNWQRVFPTQEQAEAFMDGVDFVNDGSIEIIGIEPHEGEGGGWVVLLWDADRESDDCRPDGSPLITPKNQLDNELE